MKQYKAIFFDWDGTAVLSRKAPVDDAIAAMRPLLAQGTALVVVSGTTYENIAGGRLHTHFTKAELQNLYLGLGRGAFDYAFDANGQPYLLHDRMPDVQTLLQLHRLCFALHTALLEQHSYNTDIVFTRPNYCKVDLLADVDRGDNLFLQASEIALLHNTLAAHGIHGGIHELLSLTNQLAAGHDLTVQATTDAKYLEIGFTTKRDNTDGIFSYLQSTRNLTVKDCAFFGDEYVGVAEDVFGSDAFMITKQTQSGDFFDVSETPGSRPKEVQCVGGGVEAFLSILYRQGHSVR